MENQQNLSKHSNLWLLAGIASILIILVGLGIPYIFMNYNVRHALPLVIGIVLLVLTITSKDPIRLYLYLFTLILPVYIVLYFTPLPADMPEHPGLLDYPAFYPHDVPFWMLVILLSLNSLLNKQHQLRFPKLLIPLAIYLVPAFISTLGAREPSLGYYELMRTLKMIAITLVIANAITKKKHLWICLGIIFVGIIIQDIVSILQLRYPDQMILFMENIGIYPNIINSIPDDPDSAFRICGTTGYCNSLAGYFELTLPIFIMLLFFAPLKRWFRWVIVGMLFITAPIFFLTYSRGGFLGLAVILTITTAFWVKKLSKHLKHFFLISLIILVFLGSLGYVTERLTTSRLEETGGLFTDKVRTTLIKTAYLMISDKPFFGVGLNNFPENLLKYDRSGTEYEIPYPVHNTYLLSAAETGIIGALFLLWFFFRGVKTAYRATKTKDPILQAIAIGLLAGMLGWLTHNLVAPLYQNWLINRLTFMFLLGVAFVIPRLAKSDEEKVSLPPEIAPK